MLALMQGMRAHLVSSTIVQTPPSDDLVKGMHCTVCVLFKYADWETLIV